MKQDPAYAEGIPLEQAQYVIFLLTQNRCTMYKLLLPIAIGTILSVDFSYGQNIAVNTSGNPAAAANLFEVTQAGGNNTVGIFSSHTGTGTNAYAIWAEATGATNKYALVVPYGGGSVGIGTSTPARLLHIRSTPSSAIFFGMRLSTDHDPSDPVVEFLHETANKGFRWRLGNTTASDFYLDYSTNTFSTSSQYLQVTSGGNVGIGVNTPSVPTEKLHIEAGSEFINGEGQGIIVDAANLKRAGLMKYAGKEAMYVGENTTTSGLSIRIGRWSGGTIQSPTTLYNDIVVQNTTGFVGIGTTAPAYLLDVVSSSATAGNHTIAGEFASTPAAGYGNAIALNNKTGAGNFKNQISFQSNGTTKWSIGNDAGAGGSQNLFIYDAAAAAFRMLIDNNGNTGIGTTTPLGKLHIYGGYATTGMTASGSFYMNGVTASPNSGQLVWGDNTGWKFHFGTVSGGNFVERMTLMDQGNIGIGTTSPGSILQVRTFPVDLGSFPSTTTGVFFKSQNNNGGSTPATPESVLTLAREGISGQAYANFADFKISRYTNTGVEARTRLDLGLTQGNGDAATTTIMSWRGDGDVGIGTTAPSFLLDVAGTGRFTSDLRADTKIIFNSDATNYYIGAGVTNGFVEKTWDEIRFVFNGGGSSASFKNGNLGIGTITPGYPLQVVGAIYASGVVYCSGSALCSDTRYKKEVTPLHNSLDNVLKLEGVNYFWKTKDFPDKHFTDDKQIGFIAQEIEKVYPELVMTDKDGYKSVDYARLTPILVEAIKEQQKLIDLQKKDIEKLNQRLDSVERIQKASTDQPAGSAKK